MALIFVRVPRFGGAKQGLKKWCSYLSTYMLHVVCRLELGTIMQKNLSVHHSLWNEKGMMERITVTNMNEAWQ